MSDLDPAAQVRLLVRLIPRAGQEEPLVEAVKAIVLDVLQEQGCLSYVAHQSGNAPSTVVIYEGWVSESAYQRHFQGANFSRLSDQFANLLAEAPVIEILHRIA
jgi:quinol monooxygenase YgiN